MLGSRSSVKAPQRRNGFFPKPPAPTEIKIEHPSFSVFDSADKQYLHAFTSLVSLGELSFCEEEQYCTIREEKGWNGVNYFHLHQALLQQIDSSDDSFSSSFMALQFQKINQLLAFETRQTRLIDSVLSSKPRDAILYPWGPDNHRVYIEFWNKGNVMQVSVFNLGAGLRWPDIHNKQAIPFTFSFTLNALGMKSLTQYIHNLEALKDIHVYKVNDQEYVDLKVNGAKKTLPIDSFYALCLYNNLNRDCKGQCLPEIIQPTGNCVVKNLLFAIRQDCLDRYGKNRGEQTYQRFYMKLINAALTSAAAINNTLTLNTLKKADDLCQLITSSQRSFLGIGCNNIISIMNSHQSQVRAFNDDFDNDDNYESVYESNSRMRY